MWLGQGHLPTWYVYSGRVSTMRHLDEFVNKHTSNSTLDPQHTLALLDSQSVPEHWIEDIREYNDQPKWHWWFSQDTRHQELVEHNGHCITDWHSFQHKPMLEVLRIMVGNHWQIQQVHREEIN